MDGIFSKAIQDYSSPGVVGDYLTTQQDSQTPTLGPNRGKFRSIGLPVMLGGQTFDLGTTLAALQQGGMKEANPLLSPFSRSPAAMSVAKMAPIALLAWWLDKLAPTHPKATLIAALAIGGLGAGAGLSNLHQMRKR